MLSRNAVYFRSARYLQAYSLIELLICMAIIAILINVSLPSFTSLLHKSHTEKVRTNYIRIITLAKQIAIEKNIMVTICKSDDGLHCQGTWGKGSIVFVDYNRNAQLDENDQLLYRISPDKYVTTIHWRSFRNRPYLQITPLGFTNNQSGNFTFCPANNDLSQAKQIIINRTGRVRLAQDSNQDGIEEDSRGRPIRC